VTGSNAATTASDVNQAEIQQSTVVQTVTETLTASAALTPPPRPPPPRVSPQRREHHSSLPPALPPKERYGATLTLAEGTEKTLACSSSSHLVPPPLPQPRQKSKETSPTGCSRSAVADRLASKVVPPLPVDDNDDGVELKVGATPSAIPDSGITTVPKCDRHSVRDPLQLGLGTPTVGLKGRTMPKASANCDWPLDAAMSSKRPLGLPLDRASATECSVCLERPIDCVLYTCGHMCMCHECAVGVHHAGLEGGSCPICRQTIKDVIKIYRS